MHYYFTYLLYLACLILYFGFWSPLCKSNRQMQRDRRDKFSSPSFRRKSTFFFTSKKTFIMCFSNRKQKVVLFLDLHGFVLAGNLKRLPQACHSVYAPRAPKNGGKWSCFSDRIFLKSRKKQQINLARSLYIFYFGLFLSLLFFYFLHCTFQ